MGLGAHCLTVADCSSPRGSHPPDFQEWILAGGGCPTAQLVTFSLPLEFYLTLPSGAMVLDLSLLESCGLEPQEPNQQLTGSLLRCYKSAVYACLVGLQLLAGPSLGPSWSV